MATLTRPERPHTPLKCVFDSSPLVIGCALVLIVIALRAPGFLWDVLNIDESDFYLYGQSLAEGGEAYVSFVEKKPPFIYGFYGVLIAAGATDLRWIRVITAGYVLLGALAVRRVVLGVGLGSRAAWIGAFVFAAFSSNISVATDCETLMNLPVVCAAWLALAARPGNPRSFWSFRDFLAGAAVGVATGFKHQAAAALIALVGFHAMDVPGRRLQAILSAVLGFLLVLALITAWFWATGRFEVFVEWNILRNLSYTSESSPGAWDRAATAIGLYGLANGLAFLLMGAAGLPAAMRGREQSAETRVIRMGTWLYWTGWLGVVVGGRFYTHYFLQLVPGAALLAAGTLARTGFTGRLSRARPALAALMVAAVIGFGANTWARGTLKRNFPSQDAVAIAIAEQVRALTSPDDRVFVWGYFNPIYYQAQRRPATRFINPSPVVGDFDPYHVPVDFDASPYVRHDDADVVVRDLEREHCALIVDTAPSDLHGWSRFPLRLVPSLEQYVKTHYCPLSTVAGAVFYRVKTPSLGVPSDDCPGG